MNSSQLCRIQTADGSKESGLRGLFPRVVKAEDEMGREAVEKIVKTHRTIRLENSSESRMGDWDGLLEEMSVKL